MARGGNRPGSGRPKGKRSKLNEAKAAAPEAVTAGVTPLDFLLSVMRDEDKKFELRIESAKAAAPYVHKRQPQDVKVSGKLDYAFKPPPTNDVPLPPHISKRLTGK